MEESVAGKMDAVLGVESNPPVPSAGGGSGQEPPWNGEGASPAMGGRRFSFVWRALSARLRGLLAGRSRPRAALIAAATMMALVAFVHMLVVGEGALVRFLWGASMVGLALSQATLPRLHSGWQARWRKGVGKYIPLLIILIAGAWLRLHRLGVIPDDIHGDIASQGMEARAILQGHQTDLFTVGWSDIPMFDFWQMAVAMRLFGDNLFGLSMSAALHGILTLLGVYLLATELFDRRVGLLAAALLAVSYTHIHFSRIVTTASALTFSAFTFYFLARGLRGRGGLSFVLAGISFGLGLQVYYPARIMVIVLVLLLPWLYLWQRDLIRRHGGGLGLMVLGGFCAFGPFFAFGLQHPDLLIGRGNVVTIFNPQVIDHLRRKYGVDSVVGVLWENLKRTVLMFSAYGDASTHFGLARPLVDGFTAALLTLGMGYSLRRVRQARYFLLLVWVISVLLLGSFISNDPPFWPHLVIVLIPVCILAAIALERLWQAGAMLLGETGDRLGGALIAAALIYVGLGNWTVYYALVRDNALPLVRLGRIIAALPPSVPVLLIKEPFSGSERELAFLGYGHPIRALDEAEAVDPDQTSATDALFVVTPHHRAVLEALRARYPDATEKRYHSAHGDLLFTTLRVRGNMTAAQAERTPGAVAQPSAPSTPAPTSWSPRHTFIGNTTSAPWDIDVGIVEVSGGRLTLRVGPIPGHDAVYDYVRLVGPHGDELRFEAEDSRYTTGDDVYASREGRDGHWWLQHYGPFSDQKGLVAQKDEGAPILTTTVPLPDGTYHLYIGSFYGDPSNGVFALGVDY
jgi:4-amino-4-deoxy-L-arabinose transferase-like glycosyltransferase